MDRFGVNFDLFLNIHKYRGIALSSILGKVLDHVMLVKYKDVFSSNSMQFGFKKKMSTTQCTFVLNETMQYYTNRGTGVYTMLLDASKAFDRVNYIKLFKLLLKKGCCPLVARFLAMLYTEQNVSVSWQGKRSYAFGVRNGVKQGGVLSPILFCIYIDELLDRLKSAGFGCYFGSMFMGVLAYADDILTPTRYGLRKLLCISSEFSINYNVIFNPEMSKLLYFSADGVQRDHLPLQWSGQNIFVSEYGIHLGHYFGTDSLERNLDSSIAMIYSRLNNFISVFGHCFSHIKYKLFKSFAMALYGYVNGTSRPRSWKKYV